MMDWRLMGSRSAYLHVLCRLYITQHTHLHTLHPRNSLAALQYELPVRLLHAPAAGLAHAPLLQHRAPLLGQVLRSTAVCVKSV